MGVPPEHDGLRHLVFSAGPGNGSVVFRLGLGYLPLEPYHDPQSRGIVVQKAVQRPDHANDGHCGGPALLSARSGDVLCVTVRITTPDNLGGVSIVDLAPGGLEPLDSKLASGRAIARAAGVRSSGNRLHWWWPRVSRQTRKASVTWHVDSLYAGTHTFSYVCVANVPGVYSLPAARAFETAHIELMGTSGAGLFTVHDSAHSENDFLHIRHSAIGNSTTPLFLTAGVQQSPKVCSSGCSSGEVCNIGHGICECVSLSGSRADCTSRTPTRAELLLSHSGKGSKV